MTPMLRARWLMLATFGLMTAGAQPQAGQSSGSAEEVAFKQAIRKLYDLKERAWTKGDVESIVTSFYAPDAISVGQGNPVAARTLRRLTGG